MNQEDSAKIVAEFQKRFRIAESAESKNREIWKKDRRFVYHDEAQWEDSGAILTAQGHSQPPRCSPAISSTRHGKALSRSRFTRSTSSGQAPANVVSGLLRNTEHTSNAEDEYASAEDAVTGGYGELRILVDYESPESFQLAPKIVSIRTRIPFCAIRSIRIQPERMPSGPSFSLGSTRKSSRKNGPTLRLPTCAAIQSLSGRTRRMAS